MVWVCWSHESQTNHDNSNWVPLSYIWWPAMPPAPFIFCLQVILSGEHMGSSCYKQSLAYVGCRVKMVHPYRPYDHTHHLKILAIERSIEVGPTTKPITLYCMHRLVVVQHYKFNTVHGKTIKRGTHPNTTQHNTMWMKYGKQSQRFLNRLITWEWGVVYPEGII